MKYFLILAIISLTLSCLTEKEDKEATRKAEQIKFEVDLKRYTDSTEKAMAHYADSSTKETIRIVDSLIASRAKSVK